MRTRVDEMRSPRHSIFFVIAPRGRRRRVSHSTRNFLHDCTVGVNETVCGRSSYIKSNTLSYTKTKFQARRGHRICTTRSKTDAQRHVTHDTHIRSYARAGAQRTHGDMGGASHTSHDTHTQHHSSPDNYSLRFWTSPELRTRRPHAANPQHSRAIDLN